MATQGQVTEVDGQLLRAGVAKVRVHSYRATHGLLHLLIRHEKVSHLYLNECARICGPTAGNWQLRVELRESALVSVRSDDGVFEAIGTDVSTGEGVFAFNDRAAIRAMHTALRCVSESDPDSVETRNVEAVVREVIRLIATSQDPPSEKIISAFSSLANRYPEFEKTAEIARELEIRLLE